MTAIISNCGLYRYRLERDVASGGLAFAYFGVNPSTADATTDDATVRKWKEITRRNGGRRFVVGNVFAFRATDVRALQVCADPVGPENARHLLEIAAEADVLVPCWGARGKLPRELHGRLAATLGLLRTTGKPIRCFGLTASGDPKHPLMLAYSTPLEFFA